MWPGKWKPGEISIDIWWRMNWIICVNFMYIRMADNLFSASAKQLFCDALRAWYEFKLSFCLWKIKKMNEIQFKEKWDTKWIWSKDSMCFTITFKSANKSPIYGVKPLLRASRKFSNCWWCYSWIILEINLELNFVSNYRQNLVIWNESW